MDADWVEGDSKTVLQVTCRDQDGSVLDLTGNVVTLYYRIDNGAVQDRTMTVPAPATGVARYQFLTTDLTPGYFEGEVQAVDAGGQLTGVEIIKKLIRKRV